MDNRLLQYEIDELILSSSKDDEETPFIFMDGVAIQIESVDNPVPTKSPVILTYPQKSEVLRNCRMRNAIEIYRGHIWDGDYYSIALKYGKIKFIGNFKQ